MVAPDRAVAADGDILVTDFHAFGGLGGVIRVDSVTGARRTVSANATPVGSPTFVDPGDVALEPDGHLLVADFDAFGDAGGGLIRVNPVTGARTTVSANGAPPGGPSFANPSGIAIAPGGDILVADRRAFADAGGGVIRVDPVTGARTAVSQNAAPVGGPSFTEPAGIALAPGGDILVADEDAFAGFGGIIRVDPVTGARTSLSENAAPTGGPSFVEPVGIAVATGGDLLVTEEDGFSDAAGGVIRVDGGTGARTTVSANGAPAGGPSFGQPYGIALAPNGSVLVTDFEAFGGAGGVISVNPVTGARTRVSANGAPAGGPSFLDPVGIALLPPRAYPLPPKVVPRPATPRDETAPVISSASVRPSTFAVGPAAALAARRLPPRGTSFRYRLSEPARVTFTIERRSRGRRVGVTCRRQTRANRGRRPCTHFVRAGGFSQRAAAGANRRRFAGRVGGRRLRPGGYRATLRASDPAGNRSRPRRLRFRVVRG